MSTATRTLASTPYSPVVEAERTARLSAASLLLAEPGRYLLAVALRQDSALVLRQLQATSRLLVCEGWAQGEMRSENGWCLAAALDRAAPGVSVAVAFDVLHLMVEVRVGASMSAIVWNDVPGRTVGEVLELVEDGAAFARTFAEVA
jgi:hypothetical protein